MSDKTVTTAADFELFMREFRELQELLGLTGIRVGFLHTPLGPSVRARLRHRPNGSVAAAMLNSELPLLVQGREELIKYYARHEVLHLLLVRLADEARSRFTSVESIKAASEEIVNRLMSALPWDSV